MKINKTLIASFIFLVVPLLSSAQDKRTTETKVADLLARMPSNDAQFTRQTDDRYAFIGRNRH